MKNQNKNSEAKAPAFVAFHVRENKSGKGKNFWTCVGAAWPHEDGEGFNVQIEVPPLDGKIVLRTPKADEGGERVSAQGRRPPRRPFPNRDRSTSP